MPRRWKERHEVQIEVPPWRKQTSYTPSHEARRTTVTFYFFVHVSYIVQASSRLQIMHFQGQSTGMFVHRISNWLNKRWVDVDMVYTGMRRHAPGILICQLPTTSGYEYRYYNVSHATHLCNGQEGYGLFETRITTLKKYRD